MHHDGAYCKCFVLNLFMIQKFKVTNWPKDQYGKFFNGDSYIILNVRNTFPKHFRVYVSV